MPDFFNLFKLLYYTGCSTRNRTQCKHIFLMQKYLHLTTDIVVPKFIPANTDIQADEIFRFTFPHIHTYNYPEINKNFNK